MPDTIPGDIPAAPSPALPETVPDVPMQEEEPDRQSDHEMDLDQPATLCDEDERMADNDVTSAVNEKSLEKEDSLASTASLGESWEREFYDYKKENGKWVKYIKDKYVALAKARNWSLGPIDITAEAAPPMEKLGVLSIKAGQTSDQQPDAAVPTSAEPKALVQQPPAAAPTSEPKIPVQQPNAAAPTSSEPEIPVQQHKAAAPTNEPKIPVQQPDASAVEKEKPDRPVLQEAAGPPDRTLELAGLQALMKGQVEREQAAALAEATRVEGLLNPGPRAVAETAGPDRVDWVTHKKEGMRLKRLLEESADGAKSFPHMAKMWAGSKEDMGFKHVDCEI